MKKRKQLQYKGKTYNFISIRQLARDGLFNRSSFNTYKNKHNRSFTIKTVTDYLKHRDNLKNYPNSILIKGRNYRSIRECFKKLKLNTRSYMYSSFKKKGKQYSKDNIIEFISTRLYNYKTQRNKQKVILKQILVK